MNLQTLLALPLLIAVCSPALAKDCPVIDRRSGTQAERRPGCDIDRRAAQPAARESLRAERGVVDLGNGTTVRIGGRVRAEAAGRR